MGFHLPTQILAAAVKLLLATLLFSLSLFLLLEIDLKCAHQSKNKLIIDISESERERGKVLNFDEAIRQITTKQTKLCARDFFSPQREPVIIINSLSS